MQVLVPLQVGYRPTVINSHRNYMHSRAVSGICKLIGRVNLLRAVSDRVRGDEVRHAFNTYARATRPLGTTPMINCE